MTLSTTTAMKVAICQDPALWDAYVETVPGAHNCQRWAWKQAVEETYRHQGYYWMATLDGAIQGVLPLVLIESRLFGRCLVSVPFATYGGVLASSQEAQQALLTAATELAGQLKARCVELRQGEPWGGGWVDGSSKVAMMVPLATSLEDIWRSLSSRLRNKVRRAEKEGLRCYWGAKEMVDDFYSVFAINMRNLGTPVYPRAWFLNLCQFHPGSSQILILRDGERPVAATFVTWFRGMVELPWIASLAEGRNKYATELLYWTALKWAVERGFRRLDFGRCAPGGGVHRFKQQWLCQEQRLHWYYWLAPGARLPEMHANNPRYRLAVRVWQHLPMSVANWLGPRVVRSIP